MLASGRHINFTRGTICSVITEMLFYFVDNVNENFKLLFWR